MKSLAKYLIEDNPHLDKYLNESLNIHLCVQQSDRAESMNTIPDVPDGLYSGILSYCALISTIDGVKCVWKMPLGILGKCDKNFIVKDGKAYMNI